MAAHSAIGYGGNLALATLAPGTIGIGIGTSVIVHEWEMTWESQEVESPGGFGEMWSESFFGDAKVAGSFNYHVKVGVSNQVFCVPSAAGAVADKGWSGTLGMTGTLTLSLTDSTLDPNVSGATTFVLAVIVTRMTFGRSNNSASTGTASFRNSGQLTDALVTASV